MLEIVTDITDGKGTPADIALLEELALAVKDTTMCGLGQTASNPVLSTLRYFRDEYISHIKDKKCPAGVCKNLITFIIDKEKCTGCSVCAVQCPAKAISGEKKKTYVIDQKLCTKCGICKEVCKFEAVKIK